MDITNEKLVISSTESYLWEDIEGVRQKGVDCLALNFSDKTVEIKGLHPGTIDQVFRTYEQYLLAAKSI